MSILRDDTHAIKPPTLADEAWWVEQTRPAAETRGEYEVIDRICWTCGKWLSRHAADRKGGGR